MTFSASNTIERLCSSGLFQSLCVSKSVPKYPTSSTSATSWSEYPIWAALQHHPLEALLLGD